MATSTHDTDNTMHNAVQLISKLAELFNKTQGKVQVLLAGQALPMSAPMLLKLHAEHGLSLAQSIQSVQTLLDKNCHNASLDIKVLHHKNRALSALLSEFSANNAKPCDVVLYGFGRIGRILARLLDGHPFLRLRAVVVRPTQDTSADLQKRKSLLERDSVHGAFLGQVALDEAKQALIINGAPVKFIYADTPENADYAKHGLKDVLVIDNTGKFKDEAGLSKHLQAGATKVLLTAPAKGEIKNIVFGVNDDTIGDDAIVCAASCTTNAITPILKALDDKFGIVDGHVETVHAYTNDQNLIDNHHKSDRRGRAAALNMVITETGAAKAVGKALPKLQGRLTGNAIRVPTPNVSLAILNLNFNQSVDKDTINAYVKTLGEGDFAAQIGYSDSVEAVSSDFIGAQVVGIFDAKATIADGARASIYVWYDNEMGYSTQVLRVAAKMMNALPQPIV